MTPKQFIAKNNKVIYRITYSHSGGFADSYESKMQLKKQLLKEAKSQVYAWSKFSEQTIWAQITAIYYYRIMR